uniref:Uncharacterized protein n=1 Tax=Octactis speculum TaxID=3111310 RepID=A0A7S2FQX8_9STRA
MHAPAMEVRQTRASHQAAQPPPVQRPVVEQHETIQKGDKVSRLDVQGRPYATATVEVVHPPQGDRPPSYTIRTEDGHKVKTMRSRIKKCSEAHFKSQQRAAKPATTRQQQQQPATAARQGSNFQVQAQAQAAQTDDEERKMMEEAINASLAADALGGDVYGEDYEMMLAMEESRRQAEEFDRLQREEFERLAQIAQMKSLQEAEAQRRRQQQEAPPPPQASSQRYMPPQQRQQQQQQQQGGERVVGPCNIEDNS